MTRYYLVECLYCNKKWITKALKYERIADFNLGVCDDCLLPECKCGRKMELVRLTSGEYFYCKNCDIGYKARSYYSHPYLRMRVEELINEIS